MIILNKVCVNSNWTADFLARDGQEHCECFGSCKVNVESADGYKFILNEKEIDSLRLYENQKTAKPEVEQE